MDQVKQAMAFAVLALALIKPLSAQSLDAAPPEKSIVPGISSYFQGTGAQKKAAAGEDVLAVIEPEPGETSASIDTTALIQLGAKIEAVSTHLMRVSLPATAIYAAAQAAGVHFIRPPISAHAQRTESEGVSVMNATAFQAAGIEGAGVSVAIMDVGFSGANRLPEDMPASWYVYDFTVAGNDSIYAGEEVHGTACAEIIHDISPGAELYLLKVNDRVDLENAKDFAVQQGIDIMSSSLMWFGTGWGDGQGLACDVANDAFDRGMLWVNSAGNFAQQQYTALWEDADGDGWHNVSGDIELVDLLDVEVGEKIQVSLTWNDWPVSSEDYDLYLYRVDASGELDLVASSLDVQRESLPTEYISHEVTSPGRYVVGTRKAPGARAVLLKLFSRNHDLEDISGVIGSLASPADATGVLTVGALYYGNYGSGPIESYSSQGPTADGRIKPDLVAPAGVATVSYGAAGYFGTSAAAPHVAGIAALLKSRRPFATMAEIRDEIFSSTIDLGDPGFDNVFGRGSLVLQAPVALDTDLNREVGGYWELDDGRMIVDKEWRFTSQQGRATGLGVQGTFSILWQNETTEPKTVSYHVRFLDQDGVELARFTPSGTHQVEPGIDVTTAETFDVEFRSIEEANASRMALYASFTTVQDHIADVRVSPTSLAGSPGETVNFTVRGLGLSGVRQSDIYLRASEDVDVSTLDQVSVPTGWFPLSPVKASETEPLYRFGSATLTSGTIEGDQLLSEISFTIPDDTASDTITFTVATVSVGASTSERTELTPNLQVSVAILPPPADNSRVVVTMAEPVLSVPLVGDPAEVGVAAVGMDRVLGAHVRIVVDPATAVDIGKSRFVTDLGSGTVSLTDRDGEVVGTLATLSAVSGDTHLGRFHLFPTREFDPSQTSVTIVSTTFSAEGGAEDLVLPSTSHIASFEEVEEGPLGIDFDLSAGDQGLRELGRVQPGDLITAELSLADGEAVTGWGCVIEYDPASLSYSPQSFIPSELIPGLLPLVATSSGLVELGGTTLGTVVEVAGGGLGKLSFRVLDGFSGEAELQVSEITLRLASGGELKTAVRHIVRVSSEDFGPSALAGDFNVDGNVDFSDFFMFADAFGGTGGIPQDMNSDGEVDFSDFFLFADAFGNAGRAKLLALAEQHIGLPDRPELFANRPNPFNATTTIEYYSPVQGTVALDVFDLLGRRVRRLYSGTLPAGIHSANWDGMDHDGRAVASGVYFMRLTTPIGSASRRMTLLQ